MHTFLNSADQVIVFDILILCTSILFLKIDYFFKKGNLWLDRHEQFETNILKSKDTVDILHHKNIL